MKQDITQSMYTMDTCKQYQAYSPIRNVQKRTQEEQNSQTKKKAAVEALQNEITSSSALSARSSMTQRRLTRSRKPSAAKAEPLRASGNEFNYFAVQLNDIDDEPSDSTKRATDAQKAGQQVF